MAEFVSSRRHGCAGIVAVGRPERRNAPNLQVKQGIVEQVQSLAQDAQVAAIVLVGAGGCFVAGTDIAEMAPLRPTDPLRLDTAPTLERRLFARRFDGDDRNEGMQAFLGKRKPVYSGR